MDKKIRNIDDAEDVYPDKKDEHPCEKPHMLRNNLMKFSAAAIIISLVSGIIPQSIYGDTSVKASKYIETVVATLPPAVSGNTPVPGTASGSAAAPESTVSPSTKSAAAGSASEASISIRFKKWKKLKTLKDGTVYEKLVYFKPVIKIKGNRKVQDKINSGINSDFKAFREKAREAKKDAKKYVRGKEDAKPYNFKVKFAKQRFDDKVLVLSGSLRSFRGGSSAVFSSSDLNFDLDTGELLTLKSIADKPKKFRNQCRKKIIRKCENKYKDQLNINYKDTLDNSVIADGNWYFDYSGIVFVADENTIAPSSEGTFVFSIKYKKLKYLKKDYAL